MITRLNSPTLVLTTIISLVPSGTVRAQSFDHSTLDTVLTRYVQDGLVDYAGLQAGRAVLDRYLEQLASVGAEAFDAWSRPAQVAYLVNAYNAYILETVIDHYPIRGSSFFKKLLAPKRFAFPDKSIRHIDGVFDGIVHEVAGRSMTLDEIEHATLRARYDEPRIHFALVCAALSCPPLRGEAYRAEVLDEQLDEQGRVFLNDPRQSRFEPERGRVYLSKIFDWFGGDFQQFAKEGGYTRDERTNGVLRFVSRYLSDRIVAFLEKGEYEVRFESYDWTLNDRSSGGTSR